MAFFRGSETNSYQSTTKAPTFHAGLQFDEGAEIHNAGDAPRTRSLQDMVSSAWKFHQLHSQRAHAVSGP
jgi:hypothetical protein